MRKYLSSLLVCFALVLSAVGAEYSKPLDQIKLGDNDTLVFLGDSITHQCLYTQYVEDYYYTRYPKIRIRFYNSGVSGDKAIDALVRFTDDVAKLNPKYVTVLLGMNDGRYRHFDQPIFDTYEKDMTTLMEKIAKIGAKAVLLAPTMYDLRAFRIRTEEKSDGKEPRTAYYNGVLAFYGSWLREEAMERGLGFVDMYSPLNNITLSQRKKDPKFTMIPDAIHPQAPGHAIMAYAILHDMEAKEIVSSITVLQEGGIWQVKTEGGKASDLQTGSNISFTFLADSLPWVVPQEARQGYELIKAGPRLSRETLRVSNLAPGKYNLLIDGQLVGTYSNLDLEASVQLQENSKTPQYQQALKVAMMNKERNDKAVRPLRNQWLQLKIKRYQKQQVKEPAKYQQWHDDFQKQVVKLQALAKDYEDKIYQANQPQPHKYEIVKVK